MTATAAKPAHRSTGRSHTLTRVCRRSAVVLGFGALTWAAFTGTAMALDSPDADGVQPPAATVGSSAPGPTISLDTIGKLAAPVTQPLSEQVASTGTKINQSLDALPTSPSAPSTDIGDRAGGPGSRTSGSVRDTDDDPLTTATTVVGDHLGSALHTLGHPRSTQPAPSGAPSATQTNTEEQAAVDASTESGTATDPAASTQPAGTTQLSLTSISRGVEDAAGDLTGTVLTTTGLDKSLPAPQLHVLSDTLDSLGVDSALPALTVPELPLPTETLRTLPVVGDPVGDVLDTLPIGTPDGSTPSDHTGTASTPATEEPAPTSSMAPEAPVQPVGIGAVPTLPALLPVDSSPTAAPAPAPGSAPELALATLPRAGAPALLAGTPTAYSSLADGGTDGDANDLAAVLKSLQAAAGDGSVPLPVPTQQTPGGDHGGGMTSAGHQDRGDVTTFRLPDALTTSPVRTGRWIIQAAPPSDPGFSPD